MSIKHKTLKTVKSIFVFSAVALLLVLSAEFKTNPEYAIAQSSGSGGSLASSTATIRLDGYAWSENIGWISFKDGASPVVRRDDGSLTGYAWSENVGWVQFGGLSGFPNTSSGQNAKLEGNKMTGWVRVVSGVAPSGSTVDNRGGWDGWISLTGTNYGVTLGGNNFSGFAWGSDIVGWVDMSGVKLTKLLNPCRGPYGTNIPDGQSFTFYSKKNSEGSCDVETRTCSNGVLSGSLTEISCGDPEKTCTRAGKIYKEGEKGTFYSKNITARGQACVSYAAVLTCTDGAFLDKDGNVNLQNRYLKCINNPSFIEK